jgi:hypothetical protein
MKIKFNPLILATIALILLFSIIIFVSSNGKTDQSARPNIIECGFSSTVCTVVRIDITVYSNDKVVENNPIALVEDIPSYFDETSGNYLLKVLNVNSNDKSTEAICEQSIPLNYDSNGSEIEPTVAGIGIRVPYQIGMKYVQLWNLDKLIFSKSIGGL